eukprot:TRINITY_DN8295_c0_g1_i1.p1 TRINITY_DN8295_c0_g1~~TRINITY_DN8295_c0_g1_i1.p1  ORF type:complete len:260 (-),score=51.48 TRINITY_DN8295_c0_g1_i1:78-857(-)
MQNLVGLGSIIAKRFLEPIRGWVLIASIIITVLGNTSVWISQYGFHNHSDYIWIGLTFVIVIINSIGWTLKQTTAFGISLTLLYFSQNFALTTASIAFFSMRTGILLAIFGAYLSFFAFPVKYNSLISFEENKPFLIFTIIIFIANFFGQILLWWIYYAEYNPTLYVEMNPFLISIIFTIGLLFDDFTALQFSMFASAGIGARYFNIFFNDLYHSFWRVGYGLCWTSSVLYTIMAWYLLRNVNDLLAKDKRVNKYITRN